MHRFQFLRYDKFVTMTILSILLLLVLDFIAEIHSIRIHDSLLQLNTFHSEKASQADSLEESYVIGADLGTESCRVGLFNCRGKLIASKSVSYPTYFPKNGYAEQLPKDWWNALVEGMSCISESKIDKQKIHGMCIDTTACSVVVLDQNKDPLIPCLLWMDSRSASQTQTILEKGEDDSALLVNCGGKGPLSAEWMIPKALWIKENMPDVYKNSAYICEKQDYINYKLTGKLVSSGCNVAARWHHNADEACHPDADKYSGRPVSLLKKIGLEDILNKWPSKCVAMGFKIGKLSNEAASILNLPESIDVIQGGPDAYVGMVGLGCVTSKKFALITGSSHLHLCISDQTAKYSHSIWGPYHGAPLLGLKFAEGGQSSTGSAITWAKRVLFNDTSYSKLDAEADLIPVGSEGLVSLTTFQGSRTPVTDALLRGAIVGLTLSHSRAHIWRSLLESIVFGTRAAIEGLQNAGFEINEMRVAGGVLRSKIFTQMHADGTNLPVVSFDQENSPLLGCGILATAGSGVFGETDNSDWSSTIASLLSKVNLAVENMLHIKDTVYPQNNSRNAYDNAYSLYKKLTTTPIPLICHALLSNKPINPNPKSGKLCRPPHKLSSGRDAVIMPSILSADFGFLSDECNMCYYDMNCEWVHIDVCDGSIGCSGKLTIGPQSISAIRRSCPKLQIDCHVVSNNIALLLPQLAESGVNRVTLTYFSNMTTPDEFLLMLHKIQSLGMSIGICIPPSEDLSILDFIFEKHFELVESVDILSVNPGIGGQVFQLSALDKAHQVSRKYPNLKYLCMDGGINEETAILAAKSGANVLIAGSSIFGNNRVKQDDSDVIIENAVKLQDILLNNGM